MVQGQAASIVNASAVTICSVASDGAVVQCEATSVKNTTTFPDSVSVNVCCIAVYCITSDSAIAQGKNAFIGDRTASF